MTLQVKSIYIQRFKNLESVVLPLSEVNVLVGANNAGKSAVLQAVQFMISAAQSVGLDGLKSGDNQQVATISPASLFYSPVDEVMAEGVLNFVCERCWAFRQAAFLESESLVG